MASQLVIRHLRGAIVGPINLTVAGGTCATIAGPSGSGKSLFLRMIADLDPNDGDVWLDTIERASVPAPDWRRQVVHVAAEPGWWAETVEAHFPKATRATAEDMALRLGLGSETFARAIGTLSTGEKQRIALVRALARRPKALLLDEPSSALDAASIERVEALLHEVLATGTILVLVTHDPGQAQRLGTTRYVMDAGRLAPA